MHTRVPRFASQLRLGLFVFIITCPSIGTGISFSQVANPQNPPSTNYQDIRTWELPDGAILRLGKGVLAGRDDTRRRNWEWNHSILGGGKPAAAPYTDYAWASGACG